ncbi:MAG: septal ring lytic transglycosylase RlpA family protein [Desulfobacteraceae bacterium]|nr:septal ring lytic transglycosylase RlpA family protein [Desulfobacteraceae bacterium]
MEKQLYPPKIQFKFLLIIFALVLVTGCGKKTNVPYGKQSFGYKSSPATQRPYTIKGKKYTPMPHSHGYMEKGVASWYGKKFHGRKTSNGETYNMYAMTAAHKTLPMGTWVKVYNLDSHQEIIVRINDRGPFITGRIIDLSYMGAKKIGMVGPGTARVKVTALGKATSYSKKTREPVAFKPINYWQGNFTVQVGAFKVKKNAQNLRKKLSHTYLNAHIVPYEDDRGWFYRVRIGKFSKLNNAVQFSEKLMAEGHKLTFAVAE